MLIGIAKVLGGIMLTGIGVVAAAMGAGGDGRRDRRDDERRLGGLVRELFDSPQGELTSSDEGPEINSGLRLFVTRRTA